MKVDTVAIANSIAGVNLILALQRVANQLNTLTADGIAISNVVNVKTDPKKGFIPVINMWCPQTINERKAINNIAPTIALYPKIGFLELTAITSETIPKAGSKII